jgi:hypothetical protein
MSELLWCIGKWIAMSIEGAPGRLNFAEDIFALRLPGLAVRIGVATARKVMLASANSRVEAKLFSLMKTVRSLKNVPLRLGLAKRELASDWSILSIPASKSTASVSLPSSSGMRALDQERPRRCKHRDQASGGSLLSHACLRVAARRRSLTQPDCRRRNPRW